jgi:Fur family transcriptional regulator, ferric uptake regulator
VRPRSDQQELRAIVRGAGLRATPSRLAVLAVLRASEAPLSHGDVVGRLATNTWDPTTIYRNLSDFVDAGLARRTDLGSVWRFELVSTGHVESAHPHFVCTACGTIECLPKLELVTPRSAPRAVRHHEVEVQLRGLCDACS